LQLLHVWIRRKAKLGTKRKNDTRNTKQPPFVSRADQLCAFLPNELGKEEEEEEGKKNYQMASVACRCGKVELQLSSAEPRVSTECCCDHCFRRVRFLEGRGGPEVPDRPLLNSKWDNRVQVVRGRDLLFAYRLEPASQVVNVASRCCHTFLLGRHPGYDASCVTTASDFPVFHGADREKMKPSSRWFSNQWTPERLARFQPLVGMWQVVNEEDGGGGGSITGDDGFEEVLKAQLESMQREIPKGAMGLSFDEILAGIGRDKILVVSELPPNGDGSTEGD
jgi:hypothetical protein